MKSSMLKDAGHKKLLIGIGNISRGDDGLGWLFADAVRNSELFDGEICYRYQLQIEDADLLKSFDEVIFVDATYERLKDGFALCDSEADTHFTFSTHAIQPGSILALAEELYPDQVPKARIMMICGEVWDLDEPVSEHGADNLEKALSHFFDKYIEVVKQKSVAEAVI